MKNRHRLYLIPYLMLLILFGACDIGCTNDKSNNNNESAAIVNGKELSLHRLDTLHKRATKNLKEAGRPISGDLDRKMRGSILRKMIDDELIKQRANDKGVKLSRFERVEAFEQYKANMGGEKGFELFLEEHDLTKDQILDTIIAEKLREKLVSELGKDTKPTQKEIKSHYEANKKLYMQPKMVRARHILLKLDKDAPKGKEKIVLKKAKRILKEARENDTSFVDLVHKYSEGPSVKVGGDLGFFSRGKMVKSFEDAAFSAPLKKPVGPIKTDYGYHVLYVEEVKEAQPAPLSKVKDRISTFLSRNKRSRIAEDILVSLRDEANVKILDYSMTQEEYKMRTEDAKKVIKNSTKK